MSSERRRQDAIALAILTLVIALLFLDVLLGIGSLFYRDLAFYYYPAKHVLREIVRGGEFPYWNPMFSAGQPMAANPEHEVFYPLTWLILLPSYDVGFRLLVVLHLCIAAWTMYALLRSMELGATASFLGALSYALGGIILSTLNLLPYLFSLSWLPLTCLYTRRFLLRWAWRDLALAAFFLGLQLVIGEPTTALQSGLLLGLFAVRIGWRRGGARRATLSVAAVGAISIGALLVSAVQTLPAFDHARDSVRAPGFDFPVVSTWSMPAAKAGEWLYPNLLERKTLYRDRESPFIANLHPGLLVAVLAIGGIVAGVRGGGFVLAAAILSIVLAMGANTPLLRLLYDAGIARSFRYPEKFILFGTFVITAFGAVMLDRVLRGDERVRKAALAIAAVVTLIALVAALAAEARLGWLIAAARGLLVFILLRNLPKLRRTAAAALLGTFVLFDLITLIPRVAPRVTPAFVRDPPPVVSQFGPERDRYRIFGKAAWEKTPALYRKQFPRLADRFWIARNILHPAIPALHGLRTAIEIDYDLTLLQPTEDFNRSMFELGQFRDDWAVVAASMSNAWYGTTWAPAEEAYARAGGDARSLQPLRIIELPRFPRYYFADRIEPIRSTGEFVAKLAKGRFGPRTAFVEGPAFAPRQGLVRSVAETANSARIDVETAGRAFLIMSVTPHKYWTITIDGVEAPAVVTNVGYQGVVVPSAGRHVVEMRYRNPLVAAGGAISVSALLLVLYAAIARPRATALTMRAL